MTRRRDRSSAKALIARPRGAKPRYCATGCGTKLNCYGGKRKMCLACTRKGLMGDGAL